MRSDHSGGGEANEYPWLDIRMIDLLTQWTCEQSILFYRAPGDAAIRQIAADCY